MLRVFVGWDPREDRAFEVCRHSILARTDSTEVTVMPLVLSELAQLGVYWRAPDVKASTEFSLTRFLTPYLAGRDGYCIFVDCDFLFLTDIRQVLLEVDNSKAVTVGQHNNVPRE